MTTLHCSKCGASAQAACSCGAPYLPAVDWPHDDVVMKRDCKDAVEFLHILSPWSQLFLGQEVHDVWLYRGVADDRYELIPSALRSEDSFARVGVGVHYPSTDQRSQILNEALALERFFNLADASGLLLPEDSQTLRSLIREVRTHSYFDKLAQGNEQWPPKMLWSMMALAQHYGVPTRLLDWSLRPRVAAYFAAEGAMRRYAELRKHMSDVEDTGILTVWAFHL